METIFQIFHFFQRFFKREIPSQIQVADDDDDDDDDHLQCPLPAGLHAPRKKIIPFRETPHLDIRFSPFGDISEGVGVLICFELVLRFFCNRGCYMHCFLGNCVLSLVIYIGFKRRCLSLLLYTLVLREFRTFSCYLPGC